VGLVLDNVIWDDLSMKHNMTKLALSVENIRYIVVYGNSAIRYGYWDINDALEAARVQMRNGDLEVSIVANPLILGSLRQA
jgi:hypothetical protein